MAIEASGTLQRVASDAADDSTTYYNSQGEAIDHIYISSVAGAAIYVPGSSEVIKGSFWGLGGSDHAVLRAAFEFTQ